MNKHKICVYICMVYLPIVLANMNPKAYDLSLSDLRALKTVADDTGDVASRMQSFAAAIRNIGASLEAKLRKIGTSDDVASSREYQFGDSGLEQHLEITDNRITALVAKIAVNNRRLDEMESKLAALTKRTVERASEIEEVASKNETEVYHVWTQVDVNTEMISALNIRVNELELKTLVDRCDKNNFKQLPNDKLKLPSSCDSMCGTKGADVAVLVKCPDTVDEEFERAKLQQRLDFEVTKTPSNTPDTQPSGDEHLDQDIQ
mgnify:CR=1 FL=1